MGTPRAGTTRFNIYLDDELLKRVDAEAVKMGMNRSELTRHVYETYLSNAAANEGTDAIARILRNLLKDELNPQFNRIAKMVSKNTKASATGMYMQLVQLSKNKEIDAIAAFRESETKAAAYLTNRE